ncbi:MAG: N-acetyltransferase [Gaiellaceae bacterium]
MSSSSPSFVPCSFEPPRGLTTDLFVLEPLGPQHNAADYDAWSSSLEHIRATPGFIGGSWPHEMTMAENLGDMEMHARHFERRAGFTYTVLDSVSRDVIGCVYLYPADEGDDEHDASVRSWVRADRAELDELLWRAVCGWLERDWPFERVAYAERA